MRKRTKNTGTKAATCDLCRIFHPSAVPGAKHRRCGGGEGKPIREKYSPTGSVRGTWR